MSLKSLDVVRDSYSPLDGGRGLAVGLAVESGRFVLPDHYILRVFGDSGRT